MMTENGISTTRTGQEQYEFFDGPSRPGRDAREYVQYDYRHTDGVLFSCVAPSLDVARAKRDAWLARRVAA